MDEKFPTGSDVARLVHAARAVHAYFLHKAKTLAVHKEDLPFLDALAEAVKPFDGLD